MVIFRYLIVCTGLACAACTTTPSLERQGSNAQATDVRLTDVQLRTLNILVDRIEKLSHLSPNDQLSEAVATNSRVNALKIYEMLLLLRQSDSSRAKDYLCDWLEFEITYLVHIEPTQPVESLQPLFRRIASSSDDCSFFHDTTNPAGAALHNAK